MDISYCDAEQIISLIFLHIIFDIYRFSAYCRRCTDILLRAECTYPAVCFKKLLIMRLCYGYSYNSSIIIRNYYNTTENMRINR
ncbi:hypothetical protein DXD85_07710 [Ruminococcus sp. TM09-4]|nr:hypothetical protein DXD85_07710 [Ruminococcus sp. TM09-4]